MGVRLSLQLRRNDTGAPGLYMRYPDGPMAAMVQIHQNESTPPSTIATAILLG
jgi:hypothetical protein